MKDRGDITWLIILLLLCAQGTRSYGQPGPMGDSLTSAATMWQHREKMAPWFVERFKISAGFFLAVNNTDVQVENASGSRGTDIDFENDLGFNRNIGTFLADAQWRISRRSRIDLAYYGIHRNARYTLQKELHFGDHIYNIDSRVDAFFNTDIFRFSYGYALLSKSRYEAGLLIGAHIVGLGVGIGVTGNNIDAQEDRFSFTAPLPDIGIWGGYAINPRWAVNGEFSYLSLTIDNINGRILSGYLNVTYRVISKLDLSLGYTGFNFKVSTTREHLAGDFKWGYNGPSLTAAYSFGRKTWK
ncbi:outer membrane beta-barrel protein [Chitinophaga sp. MM2321]|uniref:outer membrane beta-barrel protein n=1 Tax=Chitinophaga sp. MM2321 TaxID=3137178 RepID=UPI0032D58313